MQHNATNNNDYFIDVTNLGLYNKDFTLVTQASILLYMSCGSKTASLLVNCVSGLSSELEDEVCQLAEEMYSKRVSFLLSEQSGMVEIHLIHLC